MSDILSKLLEEQDKDLHQKFVRQRNSGKLAQLKHETYGMLANIYKSTDRPIEEVPNHIFPDSDTPLYKYYTKNPKYPITIGELLANPEELARKIENSKVGYTTNKTKAEKLNVFNEASKNAAKMYDKQQSVGYERSREEEYREWLKQSKKLPDNATTSEKIYHTVVDSTLGYAVTHPTEMPSMAIDLLVGSTPHMVAGIPSLGQITAMSNTASLYKEDHQGNKTDSEFYDTPFTVEESKKRDEYAPIAELSASIDVFGDVLGGMLVKDAVKNTVGDVVKKTIKEELIDSGKRIGIGTFGEGFNEALVEGVESIGSDKINNREIDGWKTSKKIFDAFGSGAIMGGGLQTAANSKTLGSAAVQTPLATVYKASSKLKNSKTFNKTKEAWNNAKARVYKEENQNQDTDDIKTHKVSTTPEMDENEFGYDSDIINIEEIDSTEQSARQPEIIDTETDESTTPILENKPIEQPAVQTQDNNKKSKSNKKPFNFYESTENYKERSGNLQFLKEADEQKLDSINDKFNELEEADDKTFFESIMDMLDRGQFKDTELGMEYAKAGKAGLELRKTKNGTRYVAVKGKEKLGISSKSLFNYINNQLHTAFKRKNKVKELRAIMDIFNIQKHPAEELGGIYEKLNALNDNTLTNDIKNKIRMTFNNKLSKFFHLDRKTINSIKSNSANLEKYVNLAVDNKIKETGIKLSDKAKKKLVDNIIENLTNTYEKIPNKIPRRKDFNSKSNTESKTEQKTTKDTTKKEKAATEPKKYQKQEDTQTVKEDPSENELTPEHRKTGKNITTEDFKRNVAQVMHEVFSGKKVSKEIREKFWDNFKKVVSKSGHLISGVKTFRNGFYIRTIKAVNGKLKESYIRITNGFIHKGGTTGISIVETGKSNKTVYIYESMKDLIMGADREGIHISYNGASNVKMMVETLQQLESVLGNLRYHYATEVVFESQNDKAYENSIKSIDIKELKKAFKKDVNISVNIWDNNKPYLSEAIVETTTIDKFEAKNEIKPIPRDERAEAIDNEIRDMFGDSNDGKSMSNKIINWYYENNIHKIIFETKEELLKFTKQSLLKKALVDLMQNKKLTPRQERWTSQIVMNSKKGITKSNIKAALNIVPESPITQKTYNNKKEYENDIKDIFKKLNMPEHLVGLVIALIRRRFGMFNGKFDSTLYLQAINDGLAPRFREGTEPAHTVTTKSEISVIELSKNIAQRIKNKFSTPDAVMFEAVLHELAHSIESTLSDLEKDAFIEMFLDNETNNMEKVGGTIDPNTTEVHQEMFAMAFVNFMTNKNITKEAMAVRQKIIESSYKTMGKGIDVKALVDKINRIINEVFDLIIQAIDSFVNKGEMYKRGEFNTEIAKEVASSKLFTGFIEYIFGLKDDMVDTQMSFADLNDYAKETKKMSEYFNGQKGIEAYGHFNKSINTFWNIFLGLPTVRTKSKGKNIVGNFQDEYRDKVLEDFFYTLQKNPTFKKIFDFFKAIENSEFIQKIKADYGKLEIGKYFEQLDKVKDLVMNKFNREPNSLSSNVKSLLQDITDGMSEEEKDYITRAFLYTEIQNLDIIDFVGITDESVKQNIELLFNELQKEVDLKGTSLDKKIEALVEFAVNHRNILGKGLFTNPEQMMHFIETQLDTKLKNRDAFYYNLKKLITYKIIDKLDKNSKEFLFKNVSSKTFLQMYGLVKHMKDKYINKLRENGDLYKYTYGDARNPYNSKKNAFMYNEDQYNERTKNGKELNVLYEIETKEKGKKTTYYVVVEDDLSQKQTQGLVSYIEPYLEGELDEHSFDAEISIPIRDESNKIIGHKLILNRSDSIKHEGMVENVVDVLGHNAVHIEKYMWRDAINKQIKDTLVVDLADEDFDISEKELPLMIELDLVYQEIKLPKNYNAQKKMLMNILYNHIQKKILEKNPKMEKERAALDAKKILDKYDILPRDLLLPKELRDVKFILKGYKDQLLGYKEFILFDGKYRHVRIAEMILKDVVNTFKQNVIFKSIPTIMNNVMFNYILLLANINIDRNWFKNAAIATSELKQITKDLKEYTDLQRQRTRLELEKNVAEEIGEKFRKQPKLDSIVKRIEASEINEFYNEGFIQSIIDDVITENTQNSYLGSKLKTGHDKVIKKLNKTFNTNIKPYNSFTKLKTAYLTPDTMFGRALSNLVKYSDYVFRIAMYKHHIRQGMKKTEAKRIAMESFVDYRSTLPSEIAALQDYGIVPFAGWIVRMQGALARLGKNNPKAFILLWLATFSQTGLPIRTQSFNPINTFGINALLDMSPFESPVLTTDSNMVVPVIYEDLVNGIENPEKLTRLLGITLQ